MQFHSSIRHNEVLVLVVLVFLAVVQTRRVSRPVPGIKTTGQYMVVMAPDTSHERFEAIVEIIQTKSSSTQIYKIEGPFIKMIVTKLSLDQAHEVNLKCTCINVCVNAIVCYSGLKVYTCYINLPLRFVKNITYDLRMISLRILKWQVKVTTIHQCTMKCCIVT